LIGISSKGEVLKNQKSLGPGKKAALTLITYIPQGYLVFSNYLNLKVMSNAV
jgi:hypothetical protein